MDGCDCCLSGGLERGSNTSERKGVGGEREEGQKRSLVGIYVSLDAWVLG